jgi:diguanylate cyclase (GGDEF)-like protein
MSSRGRNSSITGCILIVDDDEMIRTMIHNVLEDGGFKTLLAADGAEALELFAVNSVDVVITDVSMPNLNGFELCTMVRVMPGGERVQIMFMTGHDDIASVQRAYEVGANDFALKTQVNPVLILERVRFLLRAQQLQDDLRLSEQRLSYAQRLAQLGHWERTLDGQTLAVSPVVLQMLGFDDQDRLSWSALCARTHIDDLSLMQLSMQRAINQRGAFRLEHRLQTPRGRLLVLRHQGEVSMTADGKWIVRSTVQDVTETRAQEDRIRFLAFHDPLTALPNRESALRSLKNLIETSQDQNTHVAVFSLSIDDFSRIASSLGQNIADLVLKAVGDRLRSQIRGSDHLSQETHGYDETTCLVARSDADRFVCIVAGLHMSEAAIGIAKRLQRAITTPVNFGDTQLQLTSSVGVSMFPQDGATAESLLDNANIALLHTRGNKGTCQFFASEISQQARSRLSLENELRQALEAHQFVMHYQPRLTLLDNQIHGAEALVRWQHPTRGLVMPGEFIPLLEEMDMIAELGNQVIGMVVKQSTVWRHHFGHAFRLSFNISPLQFARTNLVERIETAIRAAQAHPENIEAEITESALMVHPETVIKTLNQLRERGIRIALDDFGTGFSSLSYLRKLPLDVLKIDRSFVSDIGMTHGGSSLVNAILFMAHALGLQCVAEGVEMESQLNFLNSNRCQEVQGYLLSKALSVPDFERWMDSWHSAHVDHKIA